MSVKIETFADLKQYGAGVVARAKDHGHNITEVVYSLIGFLIIKTEKIEVRGQEGDMKNVLWCWFDGRRFSFSYTHDNGGAIVLRRWNLQGPEIARFTNQSLVKDFQKAFDSKYVSTPVHASAPSAQAMAAHP